MQSPSCELNARYWNARYRPDLAFLELGDGFADAVEPARFPSKILRFRNNEWAHRIGLGGLNESEWERHFLRFEPLPGAFAQPLALRYHGHQFQVYNPNLGDGRGFLFAQCRDLQDERLLDLGTKGSGQTPWSRSGDGRLTLKGAVREALATEMLESLGVYTSKTFSIFETGESLERHDEPSPTRSAVLVRLSHSHIRFGTFQRLAYLQDQERLQLLVDYCCRNFFGALASLPQSERAVQFFSEVVRASASLCASWMVAGFVHGVLNTDNMNVTGESFDYGPYRFLPSYDPEFTAAYFDHYGLYAYGRQPQSVFWNLERLAESLILISKPERLADALGEFPETFSRCASERLVERFGLLARGHQEDEDLLVATFDVLRSTQAPFEQFFHDWYGGRLSEERARKSPVNELYQGSSFDRFLEIIGNYMPTPTAAERLNNPWFSRPTASTLLIDEIEFIWDAIAVRDDWSKFDAKITEIRRMGQVYGRRSI